MLKLVPLGIAATALAASAVALGAAAKSTYTYKAAMTVAAEVPKPSAPAKARGVLSATVTENGSTHVIRWTLTFRNLSGKAVAAHIHKGKPGVAGGVLLGLCGPARTARPGRRRSRAPSPTLSSRAGPMSMSTPRRTRPARSAARRGSSRAPRTPRPGHRRLPHRRRHPTRATTAGRASTRRRRGVSRKAGETPLRCVSISSGTRGTETTPRRSRIASLSSRTAGSGNDVIEGGAQDDTIDAGNGNNTVNGSDGNDRITAGSGNDKLDGGPGYDVCKPGSGSNTVTNCEV